MLNALNNTQVHNHVPVCLPIRITYSAILLFLSAEDTTTCNTNPKATGLGKSPVLKMWDEEEEGMGGIEMRIDRIATQTSRRKFQQYHPHALPHKPAVACFLRRVEASSNSMARGPKYVNYENEEK